MTTAEASLNKNEGNFFCTLYGNLICSKHFSAKINIGDKVRISNINEKFLIKGLLFFGPKKFLWSMKY